MDNRYLHLNTSVQIIHRTRRIEFQNSITITYNNYIAHLRIKLIRSAVRTAQAKWIRYIQLVPELCSSLHNLQTKCHRKKTEEFFDENALNNS